MYCRLVTSLLRCIVELSAHGQGVLSCFVSSAKICYDFVVYADEHCILSRSCALLGVWRYDNSPCVLKCVEVQLVGCVLWRIVNIMLM